MWGSLRSNTSAMTRMIEFASQSNTGTRVGKTTRIRPLTPFDFQLWENYDCRHLADLGSVGSSRQWEAVWGRRLTTISGLSRDQRMNGTFSRSPSSSVELRARISTRTPTQSEYQNCVTGSRIDWLEREEAFEIINCLNDVLFQEEGFQGNTRDYYNANNSYLTFVLDRKKGIPISLAILYRKVAVNFGLGLQCVAMPGHFLLKYSAPFHQLFIDPFHQGEILLEQECEQRFHEVHGGQVEFERNYLNETSDRAVVLRMLMNLKQAYRRSGNNPLLLQILDRRLPLLEEALPEILERGLVRLALEQYSGALDDLEFFVQNSQDAKVKKLIEERLPQVRLLARRN